MMLSILILSAHTISLDRRIISQANALAENGYDVTLVSLPVPDDCSMLINKKITQIIHFTKPADRVFTVFQFSVFKNFLKKIILNKILEIIQFYRRRNFFFTLESFFLNYTPSKNFDIIHAHDLFVLPATLKIREKFCQNSKIIYDAHELFPHQFINEKEKNYWKMIETDLLKKIDCLITINPRFKKYFESEYGHCPPVYVLYNSYGFFSANNVGNHRQAILNKAGWSNNTPIGIFQGGISDQRNLENLLMTFKSLKGQCNLLIVGRGLFKNHLEKIKTINDLSNVFFMDWVDQNVLPAILKSVDFGIIPYRVEKRLNHLYCTPNKLFEFMAFKLPIFSTDLPEISRIINKYKIGFTYDLESVSAMTIALKDFLKRKETIGESHFIEALKEYGWEAQETVLLNIYKKLDLS